MLSLYVNKYDYCMLTHIRSEFSGFLDHFSGIITPYHFPFIFRIKIRPALIEKY